MKRIIQIAFCLAIMGFLSAECISISGIPNSTIVSTIPESAPSYGGSDFILSARSVDYTYLSRVLKISVVVSSLTSSNPSSVIACFNGTTNYTMSIDYADSGLDIKQGVRYIKYLNNPAAGEYNIQFYAINSTAGTFDGSNTTGFVDKEAFYIPNSPTIDNVKRNIFDFGIRVYRYECSTPLDVKLRVDGVDTAMPFNSTKGAYKLSKDFGVDDNALHNISFVVTSGSKVTQINDTVQTLQYSKAMSINVIPINSTISGNVKTYNFAMQYYSWDGAVPASLDLYVNDSIVNLPIRPWTALYGYYSATGNELIQLDPAQMGLGALYGPYSYNLSSGVFYLLKGSAVNASNDRRNSSIFFGGQYQFGYKPSFNLEIMNKAIFTENYNRILNLKVRVTNTQPEIMGNGPSSIDVQIKSPVVSMSTSLGNINGTYWNTGELIYESNITLCSTYDPWYGNVLFKIQIPGITYNISNYLYSIDSLSNNYSVDGTAGAIGTYGVKADEWNIWDEFSKEIGCNCIQINSTTREIRKIKTIGRSFGSDSYTYDTYYYSRDYNMWVSSRDLMSGYSTESDIWNLNGSNLMFMNPTDFSTLVGWKHDTSGSFNRILPRNVDFKAIQTYIGGKIGSSKVKLVGKRLTINYSVDGVNIVETIEYDARNVLRLYSMKQTTSCYSYESGYKWINKGKGALPKGDGTPMIDGFSWILLLGLAATSIGLIYIRMKKKVRGISA